MHAKLGVLASPAGKGLVQRLGLTDICLFTEARYTRHPSQADIFSRLIAGRLNGFYDQLKGLFIRG